MAVSLFTREWIEIIPTLLSSAVTLCLPLYEGVDWNNCCCNLWQRLHQSPSLRGSGLKYNSKSENLCMFLCLPLYEGVDWNTFSTAEFIMYFCLPLYEGVDWNSLPLILNQNRPQSPSLRGSGLKSVIRQEAKRVMPSPSLRGSGLKF